MARILVVDDEPRIARFVSRALKAAGYCVDAASDGETGLQMALGGGYELVLLDLLLPNMNGGTVLKELMKKRPEQEVMILSAVSGVTPRVRCLEAGAADYLPKPFELAELLARVHARTREHAQPARTDAVLAKGMVRLELLRRTADAGDGPVALSEREFLLLKHLMEREGDVCCRQELLGEVWGYSFDPGTNVVDVYVGRLRAKLGAGLIQTVRNVGYSFNGG